jgi:hypothetical protein
MLYMPENFPTAYFEWKQTNDLVPLLINGHSYKNDYRHNSGRWGGGQECILQKHKGKKDELFSPKEHSFEFLVIFLL